MTDYFSSEQTFAGSGSLAGIKIPSNYLPNRYWEIISGTFSLTSSGECSISPDGNQSSPPIAVVDFGTPNVQLEITTSHEGGGDAIYFRVVDINNWWRVVTGKESDGSFFLKIQKRVNGTITTFYNAIGYQWNTFYIAVHNDYVSMNPGMGVPVQITSEHATATKHGFGRGTSSLQSTGVTSFWVRNTQPPKPSVVWPNGWTITTSFPAIQVSWPGKYEWGQSLPSGKRHVQISTVADFSSNVTDLYSAITNLWVQGETTLTPSTRLPQLGGASYWVRVRTEVTSIQLSNVWSDWSDVNQFNIVHTVGTLNHTPNNGKGITPSSPFLSWAFSDSDTTCSQTAYQIVIENNVNGQVIIDTGKILSSQDYYEIPDAEGLQQVLGFNLLRWKVRVWDLDDKPSNFSSYNSFYLVPAPFVTISTPAANEVDYPYATPTFVWWVGPGTRNQTGYGIEVYESVGGALGTTVYATGYISSTSNIHTVTQPILETGKVYIVIVTVWDNYGLSAESQNEFSVTYTPTPKPVPEVTDEFYLSHGYVLVSWVAYEIDSAFLAWRVYRRELGTAAWTRIAEISQSTVGEYHDYLVPAQTTQEYYVTQVADRFGTPFESVVSSADIMRIDIPAGGYWLIDPLDSTNNQLLHNVTDDPYTIEYEQVSFHVIGRGRHTDIGDEIGVSGTITAQLRNSGGTSARTKKKALEALKRLRKPMRLRNPFGDIYHVSLGQISIDRVAGVGADEFVDVTIPYEENYEE